MYKKVFFSFHFDDVWEVNQIRNSGMVEGISKSGFQDKAEFETVKRQGDQSVRNWIDKQLEDTSVTAVLIGKETLKREFVQYEIQKSLERGNAIIGITLDGMKNSDGVAYGEICNLDTIVDKNTKFSDIVSKVYSYNKDDGYHDLGTWVESATR